MNLEQIQNHKIGSILRFSIPAIISMILTSLITVTDGYFAGNYVEKDAIAAINLGLPIVYLYLGVGLMFAVGGSVIAGISLGAGERKKCNSTFNQTIVLTTIMSVLLSIVLAIGFNAIAKLLGVKENLFDFFSDYYSIMLVEFPIMILCNSLGMFIRGEGNPQFFMGTSVFNVVSNAILDAIFVKYLGMGIKGIAFASLLTGIISLLILILYILLWSKVYKFGRFAFDLKDIRNTVFNGSSEFIGEMSMCITMYAYNIVILKHIGVDGVTAFTIVGYVSYIFSMIIVGFGQGCVPLISFVHGAKDRKTELSLRKITNLFVFLAGVVVIGVMLLAAKPYSRAFVDSIDIQQMVVTGTRIHVISFLFAGINTITSFYFTSVSKAKESAIISFMRGIFVLLICILTLPACFGMTGVWLIAPVNEAITLMVSVFFLIYSDRKRIG